MVSALALFNALLLAYSRIPFVLANDRLLPRSLSKLDNRGTPRNAVLVSAVFYSVFVLVPFGKLVIADVLLYSLALFLEFGALIQLRKREPELRGAFRIPVNRSGRRPVQSSRIGLFSPAVSIKMDLSLFARNFLCQPRTDVCENLFRRGFWR
jgi:amino acid transporter